jgi:glucan phosphoethanolaminetransferase (alkaline phosphatase superfamily)
LAGAPVTLQICPGDEFRATDIRRTKMTKIRTGELPQAAACLLCLVLMWSKLDALGASEFIEGRLTGSIFWMAESSAFLFASALVLTFFFRRLAAIIAVVAVLLCIPIYLYVLFPGVLRRVFGGEWSVPIRGIFSWDDWAFAGILALACTAFICSRSLRLPKPPNSSKETQELRN